MSDAFEKWWAKSYLMGDPRMIDGVGYRALCESAWEAGRREGLEEAWVIARDVCHDIADEYPPPESHLVLHVNDRVLEALRAPDQKGRP